MKKITSYIIAFFFCFYFQSSVSQNLNCKKFKNGTFKLTDKESGTAYIITRKGNIQTEEIKGGDTKYSFQVNWIDDCSYIIKATEETLKINPEFKYLIKIEIIETKSKSYTMRATIPDIPDFVMERELILLE